MAGSYPNVPSRHMAWDGDGSVAMYWASSGQDWHAAPPTEMSQGQREQFAREDETAVLSAGGGGNNANFALIFPELREVDGYFYQNKNGTWTIYESQNTTNGAGGTWSAQAGVAPDGNVVRPTYRASITSAAISTVRGLRFNSTGGGGGYQMTALHIYGEISPGSTPDRLQYIDELTGLEFALAKDFGDIARGSSEDFEIRIKNNSATLQANTIQYTAEALYLASGGWYTFTEPGLSVFAATQSIASLAAATTTGIIQVRRITPAAEATNLHRGRSYLNVSSWT